MRESNMRLHATEAAYKGYLLNHNHGYDCHGLARYLMSVNAEMKWKAPPPLDLGPPPGFFLAPLVSPTDIR